MTASGHGAGGQALGYVHQCLWALVELGRRAADDPAVELRLEALDDIQFEVRGTPSNCFRANTASVISQHSQR